MPQHFTDCCTLSASSNSLLMAALASSWTHTNILASCFHRDGSHCMDAASLSILENRTVLGRFVCDLRMWKKVVPPSVDEMDVVRVLACAGF